MEKKVFQRHKISEGAVEGEAVVLRDDIMFYLVDPETGTAIELGRDLEGRDIAKKILIFPGGKGSSVTQADSIYQFNTKGNAPKAMIIQHPEIVLVSNVIIMEVPMVGKVDPALYDVAKDGDTIRVNADHSAVEVLSE